MRWMSCDNEDCSIRAACRVAAGARVRLDAVAFQRVVERRPGVGEAQGGKLGEQGGRPQVRVVGEPLPAELRQDASARAREASTPLALHNADYRHLTDGDMTAGAYVQSHSSTCRHAKTD